MRSFLNIDTMSAAAGMYSGFCHAFGDYSESTLIVPTAGVVAPPLLAVTLAAAAPKMEVFLLRSAKSLDEYLETHALTSSIARYSKPKLFGNIVVGSGIATAVGYIVGRVAGEIAQRA